MSDQITFLGVCLRGSKSRHTVALTLEYYTDSQKLFLKEVYENQTADNSDTSDTWLQDIIKNQSNLHSIAINAPLALPACLVCNRDVCHKHQHCTHPDIVWLEKAIHEWSKGPKSSASLVGAKGTDAQIASNFFSRHFILGKDFVPYTQRPCEYYLKIKYGLNELEEALGSNLAPLAARALFLKQRLPEYKWLEANPKINIQFLQPAFAYPGLAAKHYGRLEDGEANRTLIMEAVANSGLVFLYKNDLEKILISKYAMQAFFIAIQGFLDYRNLTEVYPADFEGSTGRISIPRWGLTLKDLLPPPTN